MVTGNGMIAKKFQDYLHDDNVLIFASGVSNSAASNQADFSREKKLLSSTISSNKNKLLVYFSTCSIYDEAMKNSTYVEHKLSMEELIIKEQPHYIIFRVSNPIGKTDNSHTFLNFFIRHIKSKTIFPVWKNAYRNILDIDDMYCVCSFIIQNRLYLNSIVNIANITNYKITGIISIIEDHFNTKGVYELINKGSEPVIDTLAIQPLYKELNISFADNYLLKILNKYFPKQ